LLVEMVVRITALKMVLVVGMRVAGPVVAGVVQARHSGL